MVTVRLQPLVVNLSPAGMHFYAADFLRAARLAAEGQQSFSPASHFCAAQAAELALKAYLRLDGVPPRELKGYGHNLGRLLDDARKRGLDAIVPLGGDDLEAVRLASDYHNVSHRNRYFDLQAALSGYNDRPKLAALLAAVEALVVHLEQLCLSAS